jgi:putative membrane protein
MKRGTAPLGLLLAIGPGVAQAHGDGAEAWSFDPWVVTPLATFAALYVSGTARLWYRAGAGRGIHTWQVVCYAAGWFTLAGALVSPLHALGEHLFTAHMAEHEIIMACAAPLLALSRPVGAFLWALPTSVRGAVGQVGRQSWVRALWRFATAPLPATVIHGAVIWLWHAPPLFEATIDGIVMHRLQHLSFLLSALAFWWALARRDNRGVALLHLFATMIHTTLLGALLTLSPRLLYPRQTLDAAICGLTPLQDQQLAGLVMWVPAGAIYAGAALAFMALWVRESGKVWRHADVVRPR